jgi:predicted TPR repeat methyltransferase
MIDPALQKLAKTHPEQAVIKLAALCKEHSCAAYHTLYAHCLLKLNKINEATDHYTEALRHDPHALSAHFGIAQALQSSDDFSGALQHLKICLDLAPYEITFLFQAGFCYLKLSQVTEAQDALEKVLLKQPQHLEALINLGSCFMQQKNFAQAIYYFATACRIHEDYLPAHYNLACALMESKKYPQACDYFMRYLAKAGEDLEALYHLGFVHMMLDEYTQSRTCFYKILQLNPNNILVLHNLASIAIKENEPSVALGYYQRILASAPEDEIALYMHAALLQKSPPARAPNHYVKALFDQYAERFDEHLLQSLHYQTPNLLYQFWQQQNVDTAALSILDLGCGTGLAGQLFKPHAKQLIGVDLSSAMLEVARSKNFYDALHECELIDYLEQCTHHYELVILADVLVYIGDCAHLFEKLKTMTQQVLFSIEHTEQKNYCLSAHGRYQHNINYFITLAEKYRFQYKIQANVTLRTQNHQAVKGDLILLT